jgi:hypothetical protein
MQAQERKPATAVIFDSSIEDEIGQVLALTVLLSYDARREIRLSSLSVSRNNLNIAAFCDLMSRFFGVSLPIGMAAYGPSTTSMPSMIQAVVMKRTEDDKPAYARTISQLNDTADPVALVRNALTAQPDQSFVVVLSGPPVNLLGLLALPGGKELIQKKVRALVLAAPCEDAEAMMNLFADWPGSVIFAGEELGQSLRFPGECIEKDFGWATNHPLVDAYRAAKPMPYDAPAAAMAAVLYASHPEDNFFKLSEPGVIQISAGGRAKFSANAQGKHRQLAANPEYIDRVLQTWREAVSAKPAPRRGGRGQG